LRKAANLRRCLPGCILFHLAQYGRGAVAKHGFGGQLPRKRMTQGDRLGEIHDLHGIAIRGHQFKRGPIDIRENGLCQLTPIGGSAVAVNTLVQIAHDREGGVAAQGTQHLHLEGGQVLCLVDDRMVDIQAKPIPEERPVEQDQGRQVRAVEPARFQYRPGDAAGLPP